MGASASGACCSNDKNDRDFLLDPGRAVASDEVVRPDAEQKAGMSKSVSGSRRHMGLKGASSVGGPLATVLSEESVDLSCEVGAPLATVRSERDAEESEQSRAKRLQAHRGHPSPKDTDSSHDSASAYSRSNKAQQSGRRASGTVAETGEIGGPAHFNAVESGESGTASQDLTWKRPKEAARAAMRYLGFADKLSSGSKEGSKESRDEFVVELLELALAVCCASAGDISTLMAKAPGKEERRALRKLTEFLRKSGLLSDSNMLFSGSITLRELAQAFLVSSPQEKESPVLKPPVPQGMTRNESRAQGDLQKLGLSGSKSSLNLQIPTGMSKHISNPFLGRSTSALSDISATSCTDFNYRYLQKLKSPSRGVEDKAADPSLLEYLTAVAISHSKETEMELPCFTDDQDKGTTMMMDIALPSTMASSAHSSSGRGQPGLKWAGSWQSDGAATYHSATDAVIQGEGEEKEVVQAEILNLASADDGNNHVRIAFRSRCLRTQNMWQKHLLAQQKGLLELSRLRKEQAEQQLKQDAEVKEEQKELLRGFRKIIQRDIDDRVAHKATLFVVEKRDDLRAEVEGLCRILEYSCKSFRQLNEAKNGVQSEITRIGKPPPPGQPPGHPMGMSRKVTPQLLAGRPGADFQDWRAGSLVPNASASYGVQKTTMQEVQVRIILLGHTWLDRELPSQWTKDEDIVVVLTSEAEEFEEVGRKLIASGEAEIRERLRAKGISDYLLHPLSLESLQETITQAIHRRFGQEYLLLEALGRGGSGVVHQAKRLKDGAAFALKEIPTRRLSKAAKQDVDRETKLLQELKWPTVVFVVDAWQNKQAQLRFLLMPLLKGGNLLQCTESARESGEQFSRDRIGGWYAQTLHGVTYLHWRGVLHRDIKPGNLLLAEDCEALQIGDLGSAALLPGPGPHPAKRSKVKGTVSTPAYCCPEVWSESFFMAPSDIWSVGVSFFEVITLHPLFSAENSNGFQDMICNFNMEGPSADEAQNIGPRALATLRDCNMGPVAAELAELLRSDPLRRPTAGHLASRPSTAHRLRNVLTKWALQKTEVKQHFATFERVVRESEAAAELPGVEEEAEATSRKPLRPVRGPS